MDKRASLLKKLLDEQQLDGSFGRFHTMNSKLKQKIPTTQAAAWLMYENSFTRDNDICNKTCLYMERLLSDLSLWPDVWEKNKWCKPGVPLFIASSLALFGSEDNKYKEICNIWIDILISAFKTGEYSKDNVDAASKDLLGVEIDGSYIGLHSINNLALYACNVEAIPLDVQKAYIKWLHNYDGEIGYTNTRPDNLADDPGSIKIISLLSRFYGFKDEFSVLTRLNKLYMNNASLGGKCRGCISCNPRSNTITHAEKKYE